MGIFKAHSILKSATEALAANLQQPPQAALQAYFLAYCQALDTPPSLLLLDKMLANVNNQLKLRNLKADALRLYDVRCDIALALKLATTL